MDLCSGGNIDATNDVASDWGLVAFYATGQTRFLRVSKKNARGFINVPLVDNSLILFVGDNFQKNYMHQIDNLPDNHPIGSTSVTKFRFRKPLLSGSTTQ